MKLAEIIIRILKIFIVLWVLLVLFIFLLSIVDNFMFSIGLFQSLIKFNQRFDPTNPLKYYFIVMLLSPAFVICYLIENIEKKAKKYQKDFIRIRSNQPKRDL